MVITVIGTNKGKNHSAWVAAMTGGMLSLSNNKKVCIIQVSNDVQGVDTTMVGKIDSEAFASKDRLMMDDNGLDGLMRKAATMKLTPEHFQTSCRCMLRSENRLDVLGTSKVGNFKDSLNAEGKVNDIKRIIKMADQFYNFVIVSLPNDPDIAKHFIPDADINICCVLQTAQEELYLGDGKNAVIVANFDDESSFNLKNIAKMYEKAITKEDGKIKAKFYTMPYNIRFNDACYMNDMLRWLYKNYNAPVSDINYPFIDAMQQFVNAITDTVEEIDPVPSIKARKKKEKEKVKTAVEVPAPKPKEEPVKKKGLFSKKEKTPKEPKPEIPKPEKKPKEVKLEKEKKSLFGKKDNKQDEFKDL